LVPAERRYFFERSEGTPASKDAARVRELKGQGLGRHEIAKELGIGITVSNGVYRALEGRRGAAAGG
jgi:hypothetical protein